MEELAREKPRKAVVIAAGIFNVFLLVLDLFAGQRDEPMR